MNDRAGCDPFGVPSTPHALELSKVVKRYGDITAVNGLDLVVPDGGCVGLLGPNGAGKSTTMRMLTAQTIADEGQITVLGHDLPSDSKAARARMGVVPQLDNLDTTLTVEQNLVVFSHLYRVPKANRKAAVERVLKIANLGERRDAKVDELSGGMRRRLLIGRALIHEPQLVLLDEPTVGLDPQVRQELWALIDLLRSEGVSILMSTHYIEEAERLCDSVTIVSHGSAVAVGAPTDLVAIAVLNVLENVCIPAANGGNLEKIAKSAGFRKSGDNFVLKQPTYQFTVESPGFNPTQCHVDLVHPIDPEAPAKPLVIALHNWAVFGHGWSLYRNDKNPVAGQEFTTRSWEHSAGGKSEAVVITTMRKADGTPAGKNADTSTLLYSVTKTPG